MEPGEPSLTCLWLECADDAWRIEATATAWTGGALLVWTPDGRWFEEHYVRSVEAAAGGDGDRLRLDLDVVGDWRQAEPGASTAVHCGDDPDVLFALLDLDEEVAGCAARGRDAAWWASVEGAPACPAWGEARCRPRD